MVRRQSCFTSSWYKCSSLNGLGAKDCTSNNYAVSSLNREPRDYGVCLDFLADRLYETGYDAGLVAVPNMKPGWLFAVLLSLLRLSVTYGYFGLTSTKKLLTGNLPPDCKSPHLTKRQRKMCSRDSGLPATLRDALDIAIWECQEHFRHERWNCSVANKTERVNLLKKGMRETAYLYAVSSVGLTYALAKACSQGSMERCSCDTSYYSEEDNRETWKWGGCGDNLKYSKKFVERFLMPKKGDPPRHRDVRGRIDRHNTQLGIRIVEESARRVCKCHGISGSCTSETCWHQLARLQDTSKKLKGRYDKAVMVQLANDAHGDQELVRRDRSRRKHQRPRRNTDVTPLNNDTPRPTSTGGRQPPPSSSSSSSSSLSGPGKRDLVFIERSPNFCESSPYSPGTRNRQCDKGLNCDSICCGRGYNIRSMLVTKRCRCRFQWCCEVICSKCTSREEINLCK